MDKEVRYLFAAMGVIGIVVFISYATSQTQAIRIPEIQSEADLMGLGIQAGMRVNAGTPLDTSHHIHGWHPGYDPDPQAQPVTKGKIGYPAVPGGNISTVMHKGWSQVAKETPAGYQWFLSPPEAAVL